MSAKEPSVISVGQSKGDVAEVERKSQRSSRAVHLDLSDASAAKPTEQASDQTFSDSDRGRGRGGARGGPSLGVLASVLSIPPLSRCHSWRRDGSDDGLLTC